MSDHYLHAIQMTKQNQMSKVVHSLPEVGHKLINSCNIIGAFHTKENIQVLWECLSCALYMYIIDSPVTPNDHASR